jgi:glycosyltransferase involved in cell wall biosynthesis
VATVLAEQGSGDRAARVHSGGEGARRRVLVSCDHYLPGTNAGGPIRSISALVAKLGEEVEFHIVTRDRDLGATQAYCGVSVGGWTEQCGSRVRYWAPGEASLGGWRVVIRDIRPDFVYLNSVFSPRYSIAPLLLRLLKGTGVIRFVIAPRGELHPGALAIRRPKKRAFLHAARLSGLLRDVTWHATADEEGEQIRQWFGDSSRIVVAPVMSAFTPGETSQRASKRPGHLEVAFLSRISPKKNLLGAIEMLREVPGTVRLNIFGPKEDMRYWARCAQAIARLPRNVSVCDHGPIAHDRLPDALARNHVLLFPTHGENFGHVIAEALLVGLPVLVSDQTPWRNLEACHSGWDLPLARTDLFRERLGALVNMGERELEEWSRGARAKGDVYARNTDAVRRNRDLFATGESA